MSESKGIPFMNKRRWWVVAILLVLCGVGALFVATSKPSYSDFASNTLDGNIVEVVYGSSVSGGVVRVTDEDMIDRIRQWLLAAKKPSAASWPGTTCPLKLAMDNGDTIELEISATGTDGLGPNWELGEDHYSYAMIKWNGYFRIGPNQPFSQITRAMARRARQTNDSQPEE